MQVLEYTEKLNNKFKSGIATEHSYRSDLLGLIESLVPGITITNEPKRVACGAPDYIITRRNIPVGYIEAKDIGADLNSKTYKEQFDRYKQSLDNLIITDYLTFQFFVNGSATTSITIGEISGNKIHPIPDNFERFTDLIKNFCEYVGQTIKSAQKLSKMMAAKAKLLSNVIELALDPENETEGVNELQNINLLSQYESFKQVLIHDITPKAFADIYAQTIAYGMFAARLNDPSLENFTRQEAAELIPKSNPFLRKLFQYIAGYDLDDRIVWIVDALAEIFRATNVEEMLKDFGEITSRQDPMIHFYETFLAEYDPKLRKSCGVYYTPESVVNFIVRAVDDLLTNDFGFAGGLADNSKVKIKIRDVAKATSDMRSKTKELQREVEVHKIQILDPATGTGTFLAEVVKHVYNKFIKQKGAWNQYVEQHLIPRLNGFEILMAPYAIAHLKLDMLLRETGFKSQGEQRLKIYLTNSLEKYHPDTGTLLANWLSTEANEANYIKRDTPVMCVIGNPPYKGESRNKDKWILKLIEDYKYEPGTNTRLKEKNSKWINADEYKFLRYAQYYIEKNEQGILAFINPHSYLDSPTFRGMRWNLLNVYDRIYIIDLHGNSKKKEYSPNGQPDQNLFDIIQGVTINIFVKFGRKREDTLAKVFHSDVFGTREHKNNFLFNHSLNTVDFKEVITRPPNFYFITKNYANSAQYKRGFSLDALFQVNGNGIVSKRDEVAFQESKNNIFEVVKSIIDLSNEEIKAKYNKVNWESRDGKVEFCKRDLMELGIKDDNFVQCSYRPFDKKWTYYTGKSKGFIGWPVKKVMQHYLLGDNVGLVVGRQGQAVGSMPWNLVFITDAISDFNLFYRGGAMSFPLYLYPEDKEQYTFNGTYSRRPNFNQAILDEITRNLGVGFSNEKSISSTETIDIIAPIDILDYIYAVLHSSIYRAEYKDFLREEFPIIPYSQDRRSFWQLVMLGGKLREIHLFINPIIEKYLTSFPISGSNEVVKLKYEKGNTWINDTQYFENVPQAVWNFYIGGYQPAQKWLKDRKGRALSFDDIMYYQKIIVALTETDRIMKEIDKIDLLP
jgi:predicted helicase